LAPPLSPFASVEFCSTRSAPLSRTINSLKNRLQNRIGELNLSSSPAEISAFTTKLRIVAQGSQQVDVIQAYNPNAAYYGKIVSPNDKVLLRWKLDDGCYDVIFDDLRSETVTAEKLRALEGKDGASSRRRVGDGDSLTVTGV
jgi:hypothetical protein